MSGLKITGRLLQAAALATATAAVVTVAAGRAGAAAPTYTVTSLPAPISYGPAQTPWGNLFSPTGVTSAGYVLYPLAGLLVNGSYVRPTNATAPASTTTPGSMVMLDTNDSGLVIGFIQVPGNQQAAYWQWSASGSQYHVINLSSVVPAGTSPTYSEADLVDDTGAIEGMVGYSNAQQTVGGRVHFYLSSPSATPVAITDPANSDPVTQVQGVNTPWEIASDQSGEFRYNRTTKVRDVVDVPGEIAISARGTVLGSGSEVHADGSTTSLAVPSGDHADATSISNGDIAVGYTYDTATSSGVWDRTGAFTSFASITGTNYTQVITGPSGRIAALYYTGSSWDASLLTPVHPPPPVVNSSGDAAATDNGANGCDTGATVTIGGSPQSECTLRAAIQAANFADDGESITFAAANHAALQLRPQSALPTITAAGTTIDFSTEGAPVLLLPDYSTGTTVGLDVAAANVAIRGLYAASWGRDVVLEAPGHDSVVASYLGTSPQDSQIAPGAGLEVRDSPDNVIGGTAAADTDVISGNSIGVYIDGGGSSGNKVEGDELGTDLAGTDHQANGADVLVRDGSNNTIGGKTASVGTGAGNLLLGGGQGAGQAIDIVGVSTKATGNVVAGNLIGLDRSGTSSLPVAAQNEVVVAGSTQDTRIGGGAGEGNVISGESDIEVSIDSTQTTGTQILGNLIGTNAAGSKQVDLGSAAYGIRVQGATHTTIGQPGEGNTVAGFATALVASSPTSGKPTLLFPSPVTLPGGGATTKGATSTHVEGNTLGAVADGRSFPEEVTTRGVSLTGKGDLVQHNLIDGAVYGVVVQSATGVETVDGNKLGIDSTGVRSLKNLIDVLVENSPHAVIGTSAQPNVLYGHDVGIGIEGSSEVTVRSNHIGVTATGDTVVAAGKAAVPKDLDSDVKQARAGINIDKGSGGSEIAGNTIGGLPGPGILATGTKELEISGNHVGVGANGKADVGNAGSGIVVQAAPAPIVGATLSGANQQTVSVRNEVAHNGKFGLDLVAVPHPRLLSDRLWANKDGGIEASSGYPAPDRPGLISAINHGGHTNLELREAEDDDGVLQVWKAPSCAARPEAEDILMTKALGFSARGHTLALKTEPVGTHLIAAFTTAKAGTSPYSRCLTVAPSR